MVVDTSALLAVLFQEEDGDFYAEKLAITERKLIAPFNALEAEIVLEARKGDEGRRELDLLFYHSMIDIVPFDRAMTSLAAEAWRQFGKGHHPAGLNLGDCCAYALSVYTREPLLFKGDDFDQTDVKAVG
jgi:ribonuclease VapC